MIFHPYLSTGDIPLFDVRSPSEFAQGHIPGALTFPLLSDNERHEVGIIYKQRGKDDAVLEGLRFIGPKMAEFVEKAKLIAPEKRIVLYCQRGGMRSSSMAWLIKTAGFSLQTLKGGYKEYRKNVLQFLQSPFPFLVLAGPTGSGKTEILKRLRNAGEQVIDLEGLANHKGSSFGSLGELPQPSMEFFENQLAHQLACMDLTKTIWIENESRKIGIIVLNNVFWEGMQSAPFVALNPSLNLRVQQLVNDYGKFSKENLSAALMRIGKKLGPQHLKAALEDLENNKLDAVAEKALVYYDKTYQFGLSKRVHLKCAEINFNKPLTPEELNELIQITVDLQKTIKVNMKASI